VLVAQGLSPEIGPPTPGPSACGAAASTGDQGAHPFAYLTWPNRSQATSRDDQVKVKKRSGSSSPVGALSGTSRRLRGEAVEARPRRLSRPGRTAAIAFCRGTRSTGRPLRWAA